jgi:hypothetical protein
VQVLNLPKSGYGLHEEGKSFSPFADCMRGKKKYLGVPR